MKKILLKCLLLGLCIGAVESEVAGGNIESVIESSELAVNDEDFQPLSIGGLTWKM